MPFKSQAQKAKMGILVGEGKLDRKVYKEFEKETGNKKLPKKLKPKSTDDLRKIYKEKYGK